MLRIMRQRLGQALCSCQQKTWLPGWLEWDYDYSANAPPENDSLNIIFDVFYLPFLTDTSMTQLDSTQTHELRLLTYDLLYQNRTWYFFCRARSLVDGAVSVNSDTISAYFPEILSGKPYEVKVLQTKLP